MPEGVFGAVPPTATSKASRPTADAVSSNTSESDMTDTVHCVKCQSPYAYEDRGMFICPECAHEWSGEEGQDDGDNEAAVVRDANGAVLTDGDTVMVIKDLKIKGSSSVVKVGTKVKNIRLVEGDHDIDCKIPGIGQMGLKSEFVKKVAD
jgi:protein PhnA